MSIISGKNSITQLKMLLNDFHSKRVLLVTGNGFYEKCGAKLYIESISKDISFFVFSDFEENPKIEDVKKGIEILTSNNCDLIIAIGGGSYIDMAKSINALHQIDDNLIVEWVSENKIKTPLLPFIAIPTTAGSGSESTHFAVIYIGGKKYSLAYQQLIPNHVILDIELLKSLPKYQMAVSGIDAFSQAIESLWSINSTEESINYSIQAITLLWFNLPKMIGNPNDENLIKVMEGAHLAGKAINIAKTTAPHALAYGFTTYCKLPHGHSVALTLPFFVALNLSVNKYNCREIRGVDWVVEKLQMIGDSIEKPYFNLHFFISEFIQSCGLEIDFESLGINIITFEKIISDVNLERLSNNPVRVDLSNLRSLYSFNKDLNVS